MHCSPQHRSAWLLLPALALAAVGCDGDDSVRAYWAPKDPPPVAQVAQDRPPQQGGSPQWTLPPGWKPVSGGPIRFATLGVSPEHPDVVLTVVSFPGDAGGLRANVIRWAGQLKLPPSPEPDLGKVVNHVDVGPLHVDVVDLNGPEPADGTPRQRLLGAIVPQGGQSWFFKLSGPADVVTAQKANFDAFIASLRFTEPAEAGVTSADGPGAPRADVAAAAGPTRITNFETPAGWTQNPAAVAPPRVLAFGVGSPSLPASADSGAEVTVMKLDGPSASGVENIGKWRSEVGLEPSGDLATASPEPTTIGPKGGVIVDLAGPSTAPQPRKRVVVAITLTGQEFWVFKMLGPADVIEQQRPAFLAFLASIQFGPDAAAAQPAPSSAQESASPPQPPVPQPAGPPAPPVGTQPAPATPIPPPPVSTEPAPARPDPPAAPDSAAQPGFYSVSTSGAASSV